MSEAVAFVITMRHYFVVCRGRFDKGLVLGRALQQRV